jgi:hypothetical protein
MFHLIVKERDFVLKTQIKDQHVQLITGTMVV